MGRPLPTELLTGIEEQVLSLQSANQLQSSIPNELRTKKKFIY